jgi:hypothetical protein
MQQFSRLSPFRHPAGRVPQFHDLLMIVWQRLRTGGRKAPRIADYAVSGAPSTDLVDNSAAIKPVMNRVERHPTNITHKVQNSVANTPSSKLAGGIARQPATQAGTGTAKRSSGDGAPLHRVSKENTFKTVPAPVRPWPVDPGRGVSKVSLGIDCLDNGLRGDEHVPGSQRSADEQASDGWAPVAWSVT